MATERLLDLGLDRTTAELKVAFLAAQGVVVRLLGGDLEGLLPDPTVGFFGLIIHGSASTAQQLLGEFDTNAAS